VNTSKIWRARLLAVTWLVACIVSTYVLTFSQDLDSPIKWEMRSAISMLLSVLVLSSLYALHQIIKVSAWYGVIAFVLLVMVLFLGIKLANRITAASIPDLGTVHLFLRMPIAVGAGLFGGMGSLLLAHAFWAKKRSAMNLILSGYFAITGFSLMIGYFLIDALTGLMHLISVSL